MSFPVPDKLVLLNQVEQFFDLLYGTNMKLYPSRVKSRRTNQYNQDRQWVFVGPREKMQSIATYSSLFGMIADPDKDTTYYTPNGYYRNDQRLTETLRYLNAFVLDIDTPGESLQDIFDRVQESGLPLPTAIIKTPSGGYHVTYIFKESLRATAKRVRLYTGIMTHMSEDLRADAAAVGANRIFRTPTEETLVYFKPNQTVSFDELKDWRDLNHPYDLVNASNYRIRQGDLMNTPALKYLLHKNCEEGSRERTCLTLSLAMKASKWSIEKATAAMTQWHQYYCSKTTKRTGKRPFSLREALYKVKYAYRSANLNAPSAQIIRELTGMDFHYSAFRFFETAKPRHERDRSHFSEWKTDTLTLLYKEKEISGTQQEIANQIGCPLSSFKCVLELLVSEGIIEMETRRGRGGKTIIRYIGGHSIETEAVIHDEVDTSVENKDSEDLKPATKIDKHTLYIYDFVKKELIKKFEYLKNPSEFGNDRDGPGS
ncbi:hypothetical protein BK126_26525 [Paenibacillus sp. FSL H7-0326]|uniref:replication initiation protein n=1 Tax=Paenibacillus sp. FSL H7-0326 TaxID=1921144 RepID=UPI00096FD101|nr:replication initiation protein [Paenibacillus sp. FSL H7-0326]OMC63751.1 hypothetical protein BK126_26525 [Paenibacillus sp. FSL H7-0326]